MPAQLRSATVGSHPVDFVRSGLPNSNTWVPTLVNSSPTGGTVNVLLWWLHLLVHVISAGLSGFNNFAVLILQKKDASCTASELNCFHEDPNGGLVAMAMGGEICHLVGIVLILFASAIWEANVYKKYVWLHMLIFVCLNFGFATSMLVFGMAALKYNTLAFWLALPGVVIQLLSLMMVYSTASAIGSRNLNRTFIFTAAVAIDLLVALLYQLGTFNDVLGNHIAPVHKSAMWISVGCQVSAQVVLLLGRMFTSSSLNVKSMALNPFFRSIVLTLLGTSALASSFKFTISDSMLDTIAHPFSVVAMILSWWAFFYAVAPDESHSYPDYGKDEDEDDTEEMDEYDDDEEEGVEAKFGRRPRLGRMRGTRK